MAEACQKRQIDPTLEEVSAKKVKLDSQSREGDGVCLESDVLQSRLSGLISGLNEDREKDQIHIDDMKTKYDDLCGLQMERMNARLQTAYENSKDPINDRINILQDKLENIRQLERDIDQFKEMLGKVHDVSTLERKD